MLPTIKGPVPPMPKVKAPIKLVDPSTEKLVTDFYEAASALMEDHVVDQKSLLAVAGVFLTLSRDCYKIALGEENVGALLREAANRCDQSADIPLLH